MRFSLPRWLRSVCDVLNTPARSRRKPTRPTARFRPRLEALEDRTVPTASVTGILTADNHYGLFVGDGSASNLTLIGRNENTYAGNPGTYNWSQPETYNFSANDGDYLYAVVWDDDLQQMFAGQFEVDGVTLTTNTSQWQYVVGSGAKPSETGPLPATATIQADIAAANWQTPAAGAANGAAPWGNIAGLAPEVQFIWPDTLGSTSAYDSNYVIFRTANPIVPANHPPIANDDHVVTNQVQALAINHLLLNDSDPDGDALQITSVSATSAEGGTVSFDADAGKVTYTPAAGHFGSDSFTYTITDAYGRSDTATVFVDVRSITGVTATLTADNHYGLYTGAGDGSSLHFVGRNEKGFAGNPGPYNWSLPETHEFNVSTGDYIYVVVWDDGGPQGWIGQFALPGGSLVSNTTDWEYVLGGANPGETGDAPSEALVMAEVTGATWSPLIASAANGSGPWGTIPGIDGDAQFVWHDTLDSTSASDGNYVIYRTKAAVDLPSSALNDAASTAEDSAVDVDVLANDVNPENDGMTLSLVFDPIHGTATIKDNGTSNDASDDFIRYTPAADFNGVDYFAYAITDSEGSSSFAYVVIDVRPVDDPYPPTAVDDAATGLQNTPLDIDVLANDFNPDFDALTISVVGSPTHGAAAVDDHGTPTDPADDFVRYTPARGYAGTDTFTYRIDDGAGNTSTATVTVTVDPILPIGNTALSARSTTLYAEAGEHTISVVATFTDTNPTSSVSDYSASILWGDGTAADTDIAVRPDGHGGFEVLGTHTYLTPGTFRVQVQIEDAAGSSAAVESEAIVSGDAGPQTVGDEYYLNQDTPFSANAVMGVLVNDLDRAGEGILAELVQGPAHGTLVLHADGSFDYQPEAGFHGRDSFIYHAEDDGDADEGNDAEVTFFVMQLAPPAVGPAIQGPGVVPGNSVYQFMVQFPAVNLATVTAIDWTITDAAGNPTPAARLAPRNTKGWIKPLPAPAGPEQAIGVYGNIEFQNVSATVRISLSYTIAGQRFTSAPISVDIVQLTVTVVPAGAPPGYTFQLGTLIQTLKISGQNLGSRAYTPNDQASMIFLARITGNSPNNAVDLPQIRVGFAQTVQFNVWNAQYAFGNLNYTKTSSVQGQTFLDFLDGSKPFYLSQLGNAQAGSHPLPGDGSVITIGAEDTPTGYVPRSVYLGINLYSAEVTSAFPTRQDIVWNFTDYVVAGTTAAGAVGASGNAWIQASNPWSLNLSGTFARLFFAPEFRIPALTLDAPPPVSSPQTWVMAAAPMALPNLKQANAQLGTIKFT